MKLLKIISVSLFVAVTMFAVSPAVYSAEESGAQKAAKIEAAGETTKAKIEEANALVEKKGDKAAILALLGEARQAQKDFRYEATEHKRQKLNDRLRHAREAVDAGNYPEAGKELTEALTIYADMKKTYDEGHK